MKLFINFIFLCLLTLSSLSFAGRLSREAKLICSQLKSKPNFKYDAYFSEKFRLATWHFDFPLMMPNSIGIFLLAEKAKEFFKEKFM